MKPPVEPEPPPPPVLVVDYQSQSAGWTVETLVRHPGLSEPTTTAYGGPDEKSLQNTCAYGTKLGLRWAVETDVKEKRTDTIVSTGCRKKTVGERVADSVVNVAAAIIDEPGEEHSDRVCGQHRAIRSNVVGDIRLVDIASCTVAKRWSVVGAGQDLDDDIHDMASIDAWHYALQLVGDEAREMITPTRTTITGL